MPYSKEWASALYEYLKHMPQPRSEEPAPVEDNRGMTVVEAIAEIERLREALRKIADGDVPRQHAVIWRRDGELSKHDKCPHYQVMYEGCEECVSSFARAALEGKE